MQNTLVDLNNHLFLELERLNDDDLSGEDFEKEMKRADAISKVATQIVNNAKTAFEATKLQVEFGLNRTEVSLPPMLESKNGKG